MPDQTELLSRVSAPAGSGREIHDAATGEVIGRAPVHTVADLDAAVAAAQGGSARLGRAGPREAQRAS